MEERRPKAEGAGKNQEGSQQSVQADGNVERQWQGMAHAIININQICILQMDTVSCIITPQKNLSKIKQVSGHL